MGHFVLDLSSLCLLYQTIVCLPPFTRINTSIILQNACFTSDQITVTNVSLYLFLICSTEAIGRTQIPPPYPPLFGLFFPKRRVRPFHWMRRPRRTDTTMSVSSCLCSNVNFSYGIRDGSNKSMWNCRCHHRYCLRVCLLCLGNGSFYLKVVTLKEMESEMYTRATISIIVVQGMNILHQEFSLCKFPRAAHTALVSRSLILANCWRW